MKRLTAPVEGDDQREAAVLPQPDNSSLPPHKNAACKKHCFRRKGPLAQIAFYRLFVICLLFGAWSIKDAVAQLPAPGVISTIAGNGTFKTSGDGGPALQAGMAPTFIVSDGTGNIYLSDENNLANNEVRRVDASTNVITDIYGNGQFQGVGSIVPRDLALGSSGSLFVLASDSNLSDCYIVQIATATGALSTFQDESCPEQNIQGVAQAAASYNSIASDSSGNIYWTKIIPLSAIQSSGTVQYTAMLYKSVGGVITLLAGNPNSIEESGDGGPASSAGLGKVTVIRLDAHGNIFLVSPGSSSQLFAGPTVREINASTGVINTIAGGGGDFTTTYQGVATGFATVSIDSIAVNASNQLFIGDTERATPQPTSPNFATTQLIRLVDLNTGNVSTIAGGPNNTATGNGVPASSALLEAAPSMTTDAAGNVYLVDGEVIRVIGTPSEPSPPPPPAQIPQISTISPVAASQGATVTVSGVGFGATQGSSTVNFQGTPAPEITNVQWGNNQITFTVPSVGLTQPLPGTISVQNTLGTSNAVGFTIYPGAPYTSAIEPDPGAIGTQVSIYGHNFGATQGSSTVTFDGIAATPTSWTENAILVPVPAGAATGNVVITVGGIPSVGFLYLIATSCIQPS